MGMGKIVKLLSVIAVLLALGFAAQANNVKNDTTYYAKPEGNWHLRLRSDLFGSNLVFTIPYQGDVKGIDASTGARFKQCVGAGWKNLFLNIGFNPFAKNKDLELNVTTYGNKFGFEANLGLSDTMSGTYDTGIASSDPVTEALNPGDLAFIHGKARAYYAFNWKRFSYSAAMNQNRIQKRSAGSPLVTVEARWLYMSHMEDIDKNDISKGLMTNIVALGGGYAYNWVPVNNLLVHASLLANFGLLNKTTIYNGWTDRNVVRSNTVLSLTGTASIVYHFKHVYVGAFATADELLSLALANSLENSYFIDYQRRDAHLAIGVRF